MAEFRREQVERAKERLIKRSASAGQADIYLLNIDGTRLVLKDYSGRSRVWRFLIGRVAIRREARAYRHLAGIRGIPRFYGQVDPLSLVIEYIKGERLPSRKKRGNLSIEFFQNLSHLVHEMHERGVAHGDLRRTNILVAETHQPYLLDFATALCVDEKTLGLKRMAFERLCRIDRITVAKLKARYFPEGLDDSERAELEKIPFYLKAGRFIRKKIYRPFIKAKYWRRRWEFIRRVFGKPLADTSDSHEMKSDDK